MSLKDRLKYTTLYKVLGGKEASTADYVGGKIAIVDAVYYDTKRDEGNNYFVIDKDGRNTGLVQVNVSEKPSAELIGLDYYFISVADIIESYQLLVKKYRKSVSPDKSIKIEHSHQS